MASGKAGRVGPLDRIIRLILALVLLGFALICPFAQALGPVVVWISGFLGVVLFMTAFIGRCPIYQLAGMHT